MFLGVRPLDPQSLFKAVQPYAYPDKVQSCEHARQRPGLAHDCRALSMQSAFERTCIGMKFRRHHRLCRCSKGVAASSQHRGNSLYHLADSCTVAAQPTLSSTSQHTINTSYSHITFCKTERKQSTR